MFSSIPHPYIVITVIVGTGFIWSFWKKRNHVHHLKLPVKSYQDGEELFEMDDYFKLTGVPSPKPLLDFDVGEALPRPYRPFRWQYHQTMCK